MTSPHTPHSTASLDSLLLAARAGDGGALGELLAVYRPYLMKIAAAELPSALGGKCGNSDVVQNATVEALNSFAQFRGVTPSELQHWLRTILRHQVTRVSREFGPGKRHVNREIPLERLGSEPQTATTEPSPSSMAGRLDQRVMIRLAVNRLPERYRQVLVWREWDELPFAEIGRRLDISVDAARMTWWRAIDRLQEELNPPDEHTSGNPTTG